MAMPVKLEAIQTERFEVWASCPAKGILHTRVSGHMDLPGVRHLMRCFDLVAAEHAPVEAFHDWRGVTSYEPAAREAYASWSMAHRPQVLRVNILLRSKLLAMAVSVARLKLDYLDPFTDEAAFEKARQAAVWRQLRRA